jgi:anti-sigma regulatory factor (Ser/Thr protein kinase)
MGIYLARELTDELTYRQNGNSNEMTLTKNLTSGKGG